MKLRIPKCHAITHPNLYNTYSDLCLIMLLILVTPGTGRKFRRLNLSAANDELGADVCHAFPGMHAFTGCDTTSSFAFHGKKSAFKLLCDNSPLGNTIRQACSQLGSSFQSPSDECMGSLEKFVCALYCVANCTHVNDARYQLFCTKVSQSNQLPPCQDALVKHCRRANYQAAVWRQCLTASPEIPPPWEDGQGENIHSTSNDEFRDAPSFTCDKLCSMHASCRTLPLLQLLIPLLPILVLGNYVPTHIVAL